MPNIPNGVIELWRDCFGDNEKYIKDFYNSFDNRGNVFSAVNVGGDIKILDGFSDEETVGLCARVPVKLRISGKIFDGFYIYGGCVAQKFRGRGIYSALMDKVEAGAVFTLLIPEAGSDELYSLYEKRGYKETKYSPFPFKCAKSVIKDLNLIRFGGDYSGLYHIAVAGSHDRLIPDERFSRFVFDGYDNTDFYFILDEDNNRQGFIAVEECGDNEIILHHIYLPNYKNKANEAIEKIVRLCLENSRRKALFKSDSIEVFPPISCMGE